MATAESIIGTHCGDYIIHKFIGEGTFGKVYVATSDSAKERGGETFIPTSLALKRINLATANEKQRKWLDREVNLLNDPDLKKHPNIVRCVEYFIHDNTLCIVMDFCEGGTLHSYIRKKKYLAEWTFIEFADQIANGLKFLHSKKIIHRDVKTKNILLTAHNELKLADFGVARKIEEIRLELTKFVGTPNCMSPEVLNRQDYDYKADIWSFGCVCYEMGKGEFAFPGSSFSVIQKMISSKEMPNIDRLPYCSGIKDMIYKMLDYDPQSRPTASDIVENITELKAKINYDISTLSQKGTGSSFNDSGIVAPRRRRSKKSSVSDSESKDAERVMGSNRSDQSALGSTNTEQSGLQLQSAKMQSKIVQMIGDHKATTKLERILRFLRKNRTDYDGLESKVKDVVGYQCYTRIFPFVLALKGLEEGIRWIYGTEIRDDLSTAQESVDNI